MRITKRKPFTPGEILKEEFMDPYGLSIKELAGLIQITPASVSAILHRNGRMTCLMSIRLGKLFGQSDTFWLNLQMKTDLWKTYNDRLIRPDGNVRPIEETHKEKAK